MKFLKYSIQTLAICGLMALSLNGLAQENYKTLNEAEESKYYRGSEQHEVVKIRRVDDKISKKPKNVIFLIGDGMGLTQLTAGYFANGEKLNMMAFSNVGFSTTSSADNLITDSAAAGTALSTGQKTKNGAIGVDVNLQPIENIREKLEKKGLATGVVSTSAITHATPAAFIAHQSARSSYEGIAADFLKTNVDVFIGGGYKHFTEREDGVNLIPQLEAKGYQVLTDMDKISQVRSGKLAGLTAAEHNPQMTQGRGDMLPVATRTAMQILSNDKDGFFLMVEGSQIDWGGHQHDTRYIVTEVLDFDKAVGEALKFAINNKETLVIVTADHETGGMGIVSGNLEKKVLEGGYTTADHSPVMVPVMAFGPGSELFRGFYDNTDIPKKIMQALGK
jgi:alkaline phosphatase